MLSDWDRLAPGLLQPAQTTTLDAPGCDHLPRLSRYGVLFDGDWLVVAAELTAPVGPRDMAGGCEVSRQQLRPSLAVP